MTLAVNLSTLHSYSVEETIEAFVKICNQHSRGCIRRLPGFFQKLTNTAWVNLQFRVNHYTSVIEPYLLGRINTEQFLDRLTEIFNFMDTMDEAERKRLLIAAWNTSIKMTEKTNDRFLQLVESAKVEPVCLISNTNELNMQAILELLKTTYPELPFKKNIDISVINSQEPVELLPNVYLCLSYRFGAFKTTDRVESFIASLSGKFSGPITVVSQHDSDTAKAGQLKLDVKDPDEFYGAASSSSLAL